MHPPQVVHMVYKWRHNAGLCSGMTSQEMGDRRQSVSRQPSFTLSEWTDAQEDLLDADAVPQTPVFEMGTDTRTEGDAATLTVTPVGLQERSDRWNCPPLALILKITCNIQMMKLYIVHA